MGAIMSWCICIGQSWFLFVIQWGGEGEFWASCKTYTTYSRVEDKEQKKGGLRGVLNDSFLSSIFGRAVAFLNFSKGAT